MHATSGFERIIFYMQQAFPTLKKEIKLSWN